ncbi:MAG: hypothetical protein AAF617_09715, partial [Bacteroidota bacterium]
MKDWNEQTKFWAETLRIIILAVVGGFIAFTWLDPNERKKEYELNYEAEIDKQKLLIRTDVIDSFFKSSYMYTSILHDRLDGEDVDSDEFEKVYDDYRSQQNLIKIYFQNIKDVDTKLSEIKALTDKLFDLRKDSLRKKSEWTSKR